MSQKWICALVNMVTGTLLVHSTQLVALWQRPCLCSLNNYITPTSPSLPLYNHLTSFPPLNPLPPSSLSTSTLLVLQTSLTLRHTYPPHQRKGCWSPCGPWSTSSPSHRWPSPKGWCQLQPAYGPPEYGHAPVKRSCDMHVMSMWPQLHYYSMLYCE